MVERLPEAFKERMKLILQNEYEAFAKSLEEERVQGLRFNTLKAGLEEELESCSSRFDLSPIPWCGEGCMYDASAMPGHHPFHDAGVYYIQEPSAMAVAELMDVRPGEKILDLCAAPGGKSTQIAARLKGSGLLVSNEINHARAKILSQNIERMGIKNAIVTVEDPKTLSEHFQGFFDKILVDAPCSGEGMFRKDEEAITQWSEENVRLCAVRGQEILDYAAVMLKDGGRLIYSTCTFEAEEDEEAIEAFLASHSDFSLSACPELSGFSKFSLCELPHTHGLGAMYKLWPHKIEGEGHFMALLQKSCGNGSVDAPVKNKKKTAQHPLKDREDISAAVKELSAIFNNDNLCDKAGSRLIMRGSDLYVLPLECPPLDGIRTLRTGLCIGCIKKNRFEPSHALSHAVSVCDCRYVLSLGADGEMIRRYLNGQTLSVDPCINGWVLVCADEYSLGWGKAVNGVLKNHYPKGLRHYS